jgi:hypothetical protein
VTEANEPYSSREDRPTGYDLDTPVGELRVRDLATILSRVGVGPGGKFPHPKLEGWGPLKEFFDKPFPEVFAPLDSPTARGSEIDRLVELVTGLADKVQQMSAKVDELDRRAGD